MDQVVRATVVCDEDGLRPLPPVLARIEGAVRDGRFDVPLPEPLPSGAAVVKVYAMGVDGNGREIDAFGAVRLIREPPATPD